MSGQCMERARNKEAELLSVAFILVLCDSLSSLQRGIKNRESKNPHDTPRDSILLYHLKTLQSPLQSI